MIYRVMSVCWKACGVRLLSSQGQSRGGKKTQQKTPTSFCFEEKLPSCVCPPQEAVSEAEHPGKDWRCCFLWQQSWAQDGVLWGHPGQLLIHEWHLSSRRGFLPHVSWESSQILLCNRSFPWPGWIFNWLPPKHLLDTWGWITHWTDEPTYSRLFFFFLRGVGWGGEDGLGAVRLAS